MDKRIDMKNTDDGVMRILSRIRYSLSGFAFCWEEQSFREEVFLGILHFLLIIVVDISTVTKLYLSLIYVAVLVVEMINTAIEAIVDLVSPTFNSYAKKAKDVMSAAVCLVLLLYFGAWIAFLWI